MEFGHDLHYPATPDEVYTMLTTAGFRDAVAQALNVISADVSITTNGDGHEVVIDQVQRTENLPSFARKFAGESTHVIQRESWSGPTRATYEIETPGKPTSLRGTVQLIADGAETIQRFEFSITAKVPLVGGKLEKLVAEQTSGGLDTEHEIGTVWLRGER